MLDNKDYCDYETCVALKELGYIGTQGECCNFGAYYQNGNDIFYDRLCNPELGEDEYLRVPLYLAQKWLREEKKIHVEVHIAFNKYFYELFKTDEYDKHIGIQKVLKFGTNGYKSHEEALLEGIKEAVKLLKEERK